MGAFENQNEDTAYYESFYDFFEKTQAGLCICDQSGRLIHTNEGWKKMVQSADLPTTDDSERLENIQDYLQPEGAGWSDVSDLLQRMEMCHGLEMLIEGKRQGRVWVSATFRKTSEILIQGILIDITDRKLAEEWLFRQTEELKHIFETLPDTYIKLSREGRVLDVKSSPGLGAGIRPDDLRGRNPGEFLSRGAARKVRKALEKAAVGGELATAEISARQGDESRYYEVRIVPVNQERFTATVRDVTEKVEYERRLRESRTHMEEAQKLARLGSFSAQIPQNRVEWSNQLYNIIGISYETDIGPELYRSHCVPEDRDRLDSAIAQMDTQDFVEVEHDVLRDDGEQRSVILKIYVQNRDADGKASYAVGTVQDITDQKMQEQELKKARDLADSSNRAKSTFLATVTHELKTPLNAISGFAQILRKELSDLRHIRIVEEISRSGRNLLNLINDILDMTRIEANRLSIRYDAVDIRQNVSSVAFYFANALKEKGVEFTIDVDENLPELLRFDGMRLNQIMVNLLSNAVRFTTEGEVRLSVRRIENENRPGFDLIVEIRDTGIGIPLEEQKSIFEPFRQRQGQSQAKYGGTGLGLSITRSLVQMLQGELRMESVPGEGTVFLAIFHSVHAQSDDMPSEQPSRRYLIEELTRTHDGSGVETKRRLDQTQQDGQQPGGLTVQPVQYELSQDSAFRENVLRLIRESRGGAITGRVLELARVIREKGKWESNTGMQDLANLLESRARSFRKEAIREALGLVEGLMQNDRS